MIYADNAATTALDPDAFEAMKPYLVSEYGNASQPYSFSRATKKTLIESREIIAACINAEPNEIYFTSGGTESDNWAIKGLISPNDRRTILTSQIEHHAILNSCADLERLGFPVNYLSADNKGFITTTELLNKISNNTKLVSVMLANNEIGTIEPIAELSTIAHQYGSLFHTDAVQAVGHIPVDVKALGVDMLSASGHKFNAPKGIGFLYIRNGTPIYPFLNGGSQETGKRAGTENVAAIVAMACALKSNCESINDNMIKLHEMEKIFFSELDKSGIDYIRNGSENRIPGNINISIKNANGELILHRLDLMGICISTGSACDSVNTKTSHVIQAISIPKEYANGTIRISFGKNNHNSDAVEVAHAIIKILKRKK